MMSWSELVTLADLIGKSSGPVETVTPMRVAGVIHLDSLGRRVTSRMRWGFVPANAPDPTVGTKFIHARAETIEQKPTYREAFFHRRGIVPVHTFNEGEEVTPTKTRQHIISPRDGKPLGIAVVWERWSARNEAALFSFAMVTVAANQLIGRITDRMPAVIAPGHWAKWLGEEPASVDELKSILEPMEADWDMQPAGKPPPPPKPKKPSQQPDLF